MTISAARKPFTGRHMVLIMLGFFGVIIAVNVTMAVFAARTFGGKVVDNSYVATQRFNGWLESARRQQRLGWTETVRLAGDRKVAVDVAAGAVPLLAAEVTAVARHPVGGTDDVMLTFRETRPGRYLSSTHLPDGRWQVQISIRAAGAEKRLIEVLQ
jgi:nitrogen fixation protein FixH